MGGICRRTCLNGTMTPRERRVAESFIVGAGVSVGGFYGGKTLSVGTFHFSLSGL